jgi:myosin-1
MDPAVPRDDVYKSGTIHTGPGEPPNSFSRPTPKPRAVAGRPITKGKLLRPGGPKGGPSKLSNARSAAARPLPQSTSSRPVPQPAATVSSPRHTRNESSSSIRAPPPPPPPPGPAPSRDPIYRVLYDFEGQSQNELSVKKDELIIILKKENNGTLCQSRYASLNFG